MASTRKSRPDRQPDALVRQALLPFSGRSVAIGLSGGLDSIALLHAVHAFAAELQLDLSALHVNHQISPNAGQWAAFCAGVCGSLGIPLHVHPIKLVPGAGESLEEVAREARYRCLLGSGADVLLLGQHLDDQAETVMLQLLRGSGPRGLAGMPVLRPGTNGLSAVLRPWLDLPRASIHAWALSRGLSWIEDESNADIRYRRNFLRWNIMPQLELHIPGYRTALGRTARHLAESAQLLDELAQQDFAGDVEAGWLDCSRLQVLSPARRHNLLRWFIGRYARLPAETRLKQFEAQLLDAAVDAEPSLALEQVSLHRYLNRLYIVPNEALSEPFELAFDAVTEVSLRLAGRAGMLEIQRETGAGLAQKYLAAGMVCRCRAGGERLQVGAGRPRRLLKHLWQEAKIPPWQRSHWPLLYLHGQLVHVPGLAMDAAFAAAPGESGLIFRWIPDTPRQRPAGNSSAGLVHRNNESTGLE